jgi:hypothetical protein
VCGFEGEDEELALDVVKVFEDEIIFVGETDAFEDGGLLFGDESYESFFLRW